MKPEQHEARLKLDHEHWLQIKAAEPPYEHEVRLENCWRWNTQNVGKLYIDIETFGKTINNFLS